MDVEAIGTALAATREGLDAAGFSLDLGERDGCLLVTVSAKVGACEECLVPKSLFLQMVRDEIADSGTRVDRIDVVYPVDQRRNPR
jgi:hypothetical protein